MIRANRPDSTFASALPVLRAGGIAYFDSLSGLVRCQVLLITGAPSGAPSASHQVRIRTLADKGAYQRGQVLNVPGTQVIPPTCHRRPEAEASAADLAATFSWSDTRVVPTTDLPTHQWENEVGTVHLVPAEIGRRLEKREAR